MRKLTENKTVADVFRTVIGGLPPSHPCLKELENVTE